MTMERRWKTLQLVLRSYPDSRISPSKSIREYEEEEKEKEEEEETNRKKKDRFQFF